MGPKSVHPDLVLTVSMEPVAEGAVHQSGANRGKGAKGWRSRGRQSGGSDPRRLQYWPDDYSFEVFEDAMRFDVNGSKGFGTFQSAHRRPGKFDPSQGGCG